MEDKIKTFYMLTKDRESKDEFKYKVMNKILMRMEEKKFKKRYPKGVKNIKIAFSILIFLFVLIKTIDLFIEEEFVEKEIVISRKNENKVRIAGDFSNWNFLPLDCDKEICKTKIRIKRGILTHYVILSDEEENYEIDSNKVLDYFGKKNFLMFVNH